MLEVVALSALTTFLMGVGDGAAGEMGKQLLASTGVLVRRTLGRQPPLPSSPQAWETLARQTHAGLERDPQRAAEWAVLVGSLPGSAVRHPVGMPPASRHFTDRRGVLKRLRQEATRPAAGRPRAALLHGAPGIGTTAVALRLGAEYQNLFPDGQFYVDVRDSAAEHGLGASAILLRLLGVMGVPGDEIPPTWDGRQRLYRTLTAGWRALVVVDHAVSLAQVRDLVPSTPDVFLVVVVSGVPFALEAERVEVPPLSHRDAVRMMRRVAGRERVARAGARVPRLLDACAGNAFALKTEATRLLTAEQTDRTTDDAPATATATGAGTGDAVGDAVRRAVLRLPPQTARMCRLLALGGWPDMDARLAAATAELDEDSAARGLDEAAQAQLLEPLAPGRYRFRPRVRSHLAAAAGLEHGVAECSAAVARSLDALLNRALHAAHAALPASWRTEPAPRDGEPVDGEAEGIAVLAEEVANLVRAVTVAREHRRTTTATRLARALWPLQLKAGYWDEVLPALRSAAQCADEEMPDSPMAGALHFQLAHCLGELGHSREADQAAAAAAACERASGHRRGEASAVEFQGLLKLYRWEWEEAYACFGEARTLYRQIVSGQEGTDDVPRALALVDRHQGRALRGMDRFEESAQLLRAAADFFAEPEHAEPYNRARALTDLAETLHAAGDDSEALEKITEAERLLPRAAAPHLRYLADLRRRCWTERPER